MSATGQTWEQYQRKMQRADRARQARREKSAIVQTFVIEVPGAIEPVERTCCEGSLENFLSRACLTERKGERRRVDGKIHIKVLDNFHVYA